MDVQVPIVSVSKGLTTSSIIRLQSPVVACCGSLYMVAGIVPDTGATSGFNTNEVLKFTHDPSRDRIECSIDKPAGAPSYALHYIYFLTPLVPLPVLGL